ncbi:MAG: sigma-54-dependent Fis family transcriptional regulator [Myxococcales bacterium]|nr:sigma-54-dependent Fis family transcriptional regulator [Myxococcales bacterium]
MSSAGDTLDTRGESGGDGSGEELRPALVVVYATEPKLVGTVLPFASRGESKVLGRGERDAADRHPRALPLMQRPGRNESAGVFADPYLSREQLVISADASGFRVENVGKRELLDGQGRVVDQTSLAPGDVCEVRGRLLLMATERPATLPAARSLGRSFHAFGEADAHGFVGESSAAWKLRDFSAFIAGRTAHVLLLGESGTGKEVIAQSVHELSTRKGKRLVSRNAATLPAGLIDAELFGHVANYPNAGMPERPGLIAEADGSTLFLDEIGELSHELSTRLLRVLDDKGEYQRLGDPKLRTSNFRLIAATNRPVASLKSDVAARFRLRLSVPSLAERREDIPLLARHLLRRAASKDPDIGERFLEGWNGKTGEPRLAIDLVRALVTHGYRTHVREIDLLLWASLASSAGEIAELTPEVTAELEASGASGSEPPAARVDAKALTADDVRAAIERAGGVHEKAWRDLGLANRHVLKRLVKKFGLREDG